MESALDNPSGIRNQAIAWRAGRGMKKQRPGDHIDPPIPARRGTGSKFCPIFRALYFRMGTKPRMAIAELMAALEANSEAFRSTNEALRELIALRPSMTDLDFERRAAELDAESTELEKRRQELMFAYRDARQRLELSRGQLSSDLEEHRFGADPEHFTDNPNIASFELEDPNPEATPPIRSQQILVSSGPITSAMAQSKPSRSQLLRQLCIRTIGTAFRIVSKSAAFTSNARQFLGADVLSNLNRSLVVTRIYRLGARSLVAIVLLIVALIGVGEKLGADHLIRRLDADQDGMISQQELEAATGGRLSYVVSTFFEAADKNRDGKLDKDELSRSGESLFWFMLGRSEAPAYRLRREDG